MTDSTTMDLYEATTARSYVQEGMTSPVKSGPCVRNLPPGHGFEIPPGWRPP